MLTRRLAVLAAFGGPVAIVLVLSKVHASAVAEVPYDFTASFRMPWAVAYAGLLVLVAYGVGLPDLPRRPLRWLSSAALAAVVAALAISVVQLVAGSALLPRFVVGGAALVCIPWWVGCCALASAGRSRETDRDRVVLVADPTEAAVLRDELAGNPERPAQIVAVVDPSEVVATGGDRAVLDAVQRHDATVVVLDRHAQEVEPVVAQAARLHELGLRIRTLSLFYEQWLGKLPLSELERVSLLFDIGELHRSRYGRTRRLIDLAFALPGIVVLGLVLPVVWIGDRLGNRGPLFYSQLRVGKAGDVFPILKFRTMVDSDLPTTWTTEDDPRITPFGRLLRRSHLDELPQVVNILRGELSLVGPRPEQPHYVELLREKLPFYDIRHLVRPGLTGWAQVKYHYGSDEEDAMEKLQYDFYYLRHQGIALDVRTIFRTIRSVLGREGR